MLANLVVVYLSLDGKEQIRTWSKRLLAIFESGTDNNPFMAQHKGSVPYTTQMEIKHLGYIHELY